MDRRLMLMENLSPRGVSAPALGLYIEVIQVFGVNMSFISLSEVKKIYIS